MKQTKKKKIQIIKKEEEYKNINKLNYFNLINFQSKKIENLPIIYDKNLYLNYKLKKIFINFIKNVIIKSKDIISVINYDISIIDQQKEKYNNLINYKTIDIKVKNLFNILQLELFNIEKEIIKDYIVLNKKT